MLIVNLSRMLPLVENPTGQVLQILKRVSFPWKYQKLVKAGFPWKKLRKPWKKDLNREWSLRLLACEIFLIVLIPTHAVHRFDCGYLLFGRAVLHQGQRGYLPPYHPRLH